MPHRHSLLLTLLFLGLTICAPGSARAERKVVLPAGIHSAGHLDGTIAVGPDLNAAGTCALGGVFPLFDILEDFFFPPGDQYFTLLEPATCAECVATGTMTVDVVHIAMNFRTACNQPIVVSIVEAKPGACPEPDLTKVLLAPTQFWLPGPGPGTFQFELSLANPVCLRGNAFLNMTINEFGSACSVSEFDTPTLAYADTMDCAPCRYYNYYSDGADIVKDQLCRSVGNWTPGPLLHSVSGSCCDLVPVFPVSWGQLKIRYATPRRRRRRFSSAALRGRRPHSSVSWRS
jgi:hypothetical protein